MFVARLLASAFTLRWSVRVVLELTLALADDALFEVVRAGLALTVVVAIGRLVRGRDDLQTLMVEGHTCRLQCRSTSTMLVCFL